MPDLRVNIPDFNTLSQADQEAISNVLRGAKLLGANENVVYDASATLAAMGPQVADSNKENCERACDALKSVAQIACDKLSFPLNLVCKGVAEVAGVICKKKC